MSQSNTRAHARRKSISVTTSGVIPMSSLFSRPTVVDLLVVGGGGSGARAVKGANQWAGFGGGGGAGGAVIEYSDVWVCSDIIVHVGAGGTPGYQTVPDYSDGTPTPTYPDLTSNNGGTAVFNNDGEQSSVSFTTPGPFSGAYTAPGGESGGFSVQGGYGFFSNFSPYPPIYHNPQYGLTAGIDQAADERPGIYDAVYLTRYNRVHTSINAFKHNMRNFSGTSFERFVYGRSLFSDPLYNYYRSDGVTATPSSFVQYDRQMVKNPGRGNYNGSTGGVGGGGPFALVSVQADDYYATANDAQIEYPGQDGGTFADGYSTNKATHQYGAGGGGGASGAVALGGRGHYGAGSGASYTSAATSAGPNTGGGGGGGNPANYFAGNGGSGLVVISWDE